MYDLIIIGAGSSGIYAGYLARLQNLKILILESSNEHGGQMNLFLDKPVYDLPGHINIDGKKIMNKIFKQFKSQNDTKIHFNEEVLEINGLINEFVILTSKSIYSSRTVILASGGGRFKPTPLGVKNENKYKNIIYSISNAAKYINKKIVILGGGDTAIDWAHYYFKRKSNVTLVHRRESFRAQENLLHEMKDKIKLMIPFKVKEVIGNEIINKIILINNKTKKLEQIECDVIMVFYGQQKLKEKINQFKIDGDADGYFVKSNMETSRKGVFAIGNIANYKGKVKTMITGFGEASTAIGSVVEIIKPGKKMSYYVKKKEN